MEDAFRLFEVAEIHVILAQATVGGDVIGTQAHRSNEFPRGRGVVTQLFPYEGYGFLETEDGLEVYFHRHSVLDAAFDRLEIGSVVRFVEETGIKGPQASTVALAGTSH